MKKVHILLFLLLPVSLFAQDQKSTNPHAVKTIDGIVCEVLNIISGEEGKVRDWDAFRNLFLPKATFTVLYHSDEFPIPVETISLSEFIELMQDEYYQKGFTEYELGKSVDEFNGIAQVFQSFYAKDSEGEEGRGMTSYQLVNYNDRWWIANLLWTDDSNGLEIPEEYLEH